MRTTSALALALWGFGCGRGGFATPPSAPELVEIDTTDEDSNSGGSGSGSELPDGPLERPIEVTGVSGGTRNSVFRTTWGLYGAGGNSAGQLTGSDPSAVRAPVPFGETIGWLAVVTGEDTTCALDPQSRAWCVGQGTSGQLGNGAFQAESNLQRVMLDEPIRTLSITADHACALTEANAVYCWGLNLENQLAQPAPNTTTDLAVPARVETQTLFRDVSAGQGHTCAIRLDGTLWCLGRNTDLQCGQGDSSPVRIVTLTQVGTATDWRSVDVSQATSCAINAADELWCWGENTAAQLERDPATLMGTGVPQQIPGSWSAVSTGTFHVCAIDLDGSLFCWGRGVEGQLGDGRSVNSSSRVEPVLSDGPLNESVIAVSGGRFHTCIVTESGEGYCAGQNGDGRLGNDSTADRLGFFAPVVFPSQPPTSTN
ncbi:MAG: hypothetical protein AAF654_00910 [Myxococcota bacterium]